MRESVARIGVGVPIPLKAKVLPRSQWKEYGFEYEAGLEALNLVNGRALGYTPLEVGYRFHNGWITRLAFESFDYLGTDTDANDPTPQPFYNQMSDVRVGVLRMWRQGRAFRPFVGITLESVFGTRWAAVNPNAGIPGVSQTTDSAHGFEAPGLEAGVEYRGGVHWAVSFQGRYARGAGMWAALEDAGCSVHYLF